MGAGHQSRRVAILYQQGPFMLTFHSGILLRGDGLMKKLVLCLSLWVSLTTPTLAQAPSQETPLPDQQYRETDSLIHSMQERIDRMDSAASDRNKEIEVLNESVNKAILFFSSGYEDNEILRQKTINLQGEINYLISTQDELGSKLRDVIGERE